MRRTVITVLLSWTVASGAALLGQPELAAAGPGAAGSSAASAAESQRPPARRVVRAYGQGPVKLAPRQAGAITFRADRGDVVTLRVTEVDGSDRCFGSLTLTDRRGSRTAPLDHVLRVRAAGRATVWFRGRCQYPGGKPRRTLAQLVKVTGRDVPVDGRPVRLRPSGRGFVDIAWVKAPPTGRVTLLGSDPRGRALETDLVFEDGRLRPWYGADSASVQTGQPAAFGGEWRDDAVPVTKGTRVGLTFPVAARVQALSAVEHTAVLDGPPVVLAEGGGREHVVSVHLPEGTETFLEPDRRDGASTWLEPRPSTPAAAGTYHLVFPPDRNASFSRERTVRVRSIRRLPDLLVGGPPVRVTSTERGQRFRASVPASEPGGVELLASQVEVDGEWSATLGGPCYRDCIGGAHIDWQKPFDLGAIVYREPYAVSVSFGPRSSGALTLQLLKPAQPDGRR
ncbi:hypothetical protein [Nocardioides campestrisoli]|uniref:hypothetical protein n=1 Tax=Nocardioides campestrisoli TaxID=2736757 RepID=UPI00163D5EB9|nr:hypothetical protein [Nocardioides campestrisoli]